MRLIYKLLFVLTFFSFAIASCSKDETEPIDDSTSGLTKIGEAYAIGAAAKIELWSKSDLKTGYNTIYTTLTDSISNKRISTNAEVSIKPLMEMQMNGTSMSHSSPAEDFATPVNTLFSSGIVFTMPSTGESGKWSLDVSVNNLSTKKTGKALIPITVVATTEPKVINITSAIDGTKYVVSYIDPASPKVGVNDFEILINKKVSGMLFPVADDLIVEITPEMPDMGHGSPNNVNPVLTKNGHYKGKVNFTMTGYWTIKLTVKSKSSELISNDTFFKVTF